MLHAFAFQFVCFGNKLCINAFGTVRDHYLRPLNRLIIVSVCLRSLVKIGSIVFQEVGLYFPSFGEEKKKNQKRAHFHICGSNTSKLLETFFFWHGHTREWRKQHVQAGPSTCVLKEGGDSALRVLPWGIIGVDDAVLGGVTPQGIRSGYAGGKSATICSLVSYDFIHVTCEQKESRNLFRCSVLLARLSFSGVCFHAFASPVKITFQLGPAEIWKAATQVLVYDLTPVEIVCTAFSSRPVFLSPLVAYA